MKAELNIQLSLEDVITNEEYGTTLKETLAQVVRAEIAEQMRKLARSNMKKFVKDYLGGKCQVMKDEEGHDCVMVPLLLNDIR